MTFQLAGQVGRDLGVTVEYLDPSVVNRAARAALARCPSRSPSVTSRRVPVPFDYQAVRLVLVGDEALRPLQARAVVDEVRKMKRVPGILAFLGSQSIHVPPGRPGTGARRSSSWPTALSARTTRTRGLIYFLKPPGFQTSAFNGVLVLDVDGHAPQMLSTSKIGVETKAAERPGTWRSLKERVQRLLRRHATSVRQELRAPRSASAITAI